ncbi:MAG: hypothetical protein ACFE9R_02235 [Candidatus Hermodarchaeota archaeon]
MWFRDPYFYYSCSITSFLVSVSYLLLGENTTGFFFITLTFAFITIGIQFRSQEQIVEQIILNQNEIFERLIDRFSDVRINLYWRLRTRRIQGFDVFTYTVWRCRTLVDRAWKLVKFSKICKKNQKRFFTEMINLVYKSGYNWDDFKLEKIKFIPSDEDLGNFIAMCKKFNDFYLDKEEFEELEGMLKLFNDMKKRFYSKEKK